MLEKKNKKFSLVQSKVIIKKCKNEARFHQRIKIKLTAKLFNSLPQGSQSLRCFFLLAFICIFSLLLFQFCWSLVQQLKELFFFICKTKVFVEQRRRRGGVVFTPFFYFFYYYCLVALISILWLVRLLTHSYKLKTLFTQNKGL